MIDRRVLLGATLSAAAGLAGRSSFDMPDRDTEERIEAPLVAMTPDEKIGQMTLVSAGATVTGPGETVDYLDAVRTGRVGAVCNGGCELRSA